MLTFNGVGEADIFENDILLWQLRAKHRRLTPRCLLENGAAVIRFHTPVQIDRSSVLLGQGTRQKPIALAHLVFQKGNQQRLPDRYQDSA